ncbi:MAG TPA: hypothetical protein VGL24_04160 [Chthoniobacterales bacterium]
MNDSRIDRLLRAAAAENESAAPNEMPFGFDTRVLAGWRSDQNHRLVDVGLLLRRVVLISLAVIALATAGVVNELRQGDDPGEGFDQYAIADNAISTVVEP